MSAPQAFVDDADVILIGSGIMAQPAENASAALYLASDESAFVTGSAMAVDGGYTAGK